MSSHDVGHGHRSTSMGPPSRIPNRFCLMTPSASPPVHRPYDGPSPTKKRRVSQTPSLLGSRSQSIASASSSSLPRSHSFDPSPCTDLNDEDLHNARRASAARVLDIWSNLAKKYARNLDEDDIIDLENDALLKDNGILRKASDFEIGHFADEHERAQRLDNGLPMPPADDEPDELDAFADFTGAADCGSRSDTEDVEDGEDGLELSPHLKRFATRRPLDPADEADLADFLEAERLRKEQFGDPDEVELDFSLPEKPRLPKRSVVSNRTEDELAEEGDDQETADDDGETDTYVEDYEVGIHEDEEDSRSKYHRVSTPSFSPEFDVLSLSNGRESTESEVPSGSGSQYDPIVCTDSEDELNVWDESGEEDGASEGSGSGSSIGTADEHYTSSTKNKADEQQGGSEAPIKSQQSPSDRRPSAMSSQPARIVRSSTEALSTPRPSKSRHVLQLQTPPRSTSSGPGQNSKRDSTKSTSAKQGSIKKKPSQILSSSEEDTHVMKPKRSAKISRQTPMMTPRKDRLVPEVFIDTPRAIARRRPKTPSPSLRKELDVIQVESSSEDEQPSPPYPKLSKGKGKERAVKDTESGSDSLDFLQRQTSSKSAVLKARKSRESRNSPISSSGPDQMLISPLANQKRRRRESSPAIPTQQKEMHVVSVFSPPPRGASRRISSSKRIVSRGQSEVGREPEHRPQERVRSRSRPSDARQAPPLHIPPDRSSFSFTPPHNSASDPTPAASYHSLFNNAPNHQTLPNLQDPAAQFHLAQALQSLSILMGGNLQFPSTSFHGSSTIPHGHQGPARPPYTPSHPNRYSTFNTPQSSASAPPTSSPVASDYSDSPPSSPVKQAQRGRSLSRTPVRANSTSRPKSALRDSRSPSKISRLRRRVSFSSPEAIQIEDVQYDPTHDEDAESGSDIERRRRRLEEVSSGLQHSRAQTPGPSKATSTRSSRDTVAVKIESKHKRDGSRGRASEHPGEGQSRNYRRKQ